MTTNPKRAGSHATRAIVVALYEFLLITAPVLLYLALEAVHDDEIARLWQSPEWSIATVFLCFQGLSLFVRHLERSGRRPSWDMISLLALVLLVVVAVAAINTWMSMENPSQGRTIVRLFLLALASGTFMLLVSAGKHAELRSEAGRG